MPSMITANPQTMNGPENQVNHAGRNSASTPATTTHTGKRFVHKFSQRIAQASTEGRTKNQIFSRTADGLR